MTNSVQEHIMMNSSDTRIMSDVIKLIFLGEAYSN